MFYGENVSLMERRPTRAGSHKNTLLFYFLKMAEAKTVLLIFFSREIYIWKFPRSFSFQINIISKKRREAFPSELVEHLNTHVNTSISKSYLVQS